MGIFRSIASSTAQIVTCGRIPYANPVIGDYSLLLIQQNAVGMMLGLVTTILLFPILSIDILKTYIVDVLRTFPNFLQNIKVAYEQHLKSDGNTSTQVVTNIYNKDFNRLNYEEDFFDEEVDEIELSVWIRSKKSQRVVFVGKEIASLLAKFVQQPILMEQASFELIYWRRSFPDMTYSKLQYVELSLLRSLLSLDRALLPVSNVKDAKLADVSYSYAKEIKSNVIELLQNAISNLNSWTNKLYSTLIVTHSLSRLYFHPNTTLMKKPSTILHAIRHAVL